MGSERHCASIHTCLLSDRAMTGQNSPHPELARVPSSPLNLGSFKAFVFIYVTHVSHMPRHMCGGEIVTGRSQLSPFT